MTMTQPGLTGSMLVEAEDLTGGGPVVRSVDPQTGALLEPAYRYGGAEKTDRAAALAEAAFETYRHTTVEHRAAFLETIARRITTSADQLLERARLETALPVPRPSAEIARTTGQLRLFADELGSACGHVYDPTGRVPTPCQLWPDLRQRRVPLGPIAVFGASDFTFTYSVAGGDTASALVRNG